MIIQTGAFLISRNRELDYRTIVAPDFTSEMVLFRYLPIIVVDEEQTDKGYVHYCEVHSAKFGDLSLIYRTLKANGKDIDLDSDGILTDQGGREISLVEGIVIKGRNPNILITNQAFEQIHQPLMISYKEFWNLSEFTCPYSSGVFELELNQTDEFNLKLIGHDPYILDAPKDITKAKWKPIKTELGYPFNKITLISATFSPDGDKIVMYFLEEDNFLIVPVVKLVNLSNSSISKNFKVEIIFKGKNTLLEGNQGLRLLKDWYLARLSPAIFSPDGQFIAFGMIQSPHSSDLLDVKLCDHNVIKIREVQQKKIKTIDVNGNSEWGRVLTIAFTPDSKIIASAGTEKRIRFWDVFKEEEILQTFDSFVKRRVQAISFSPNGKFLVSGDSEGLINLWNWQEKRRLIAPKANKNDCSVESLAFSPDSRKLVVGDSSKAIKIYDVNDQGIYPTHNIPDSEWGEVCSISFSSYSEIFASGSSDGEVKIWDTAKGEVLDILHNESRIGVRSVAFSPKGDKLMAAMEDGRIYLWHRE